MIFIKFYPDSFKLLINNFLGKVLTHIKPHGGGTLVQFSIQNILKYPFHDFLHHTSRSE